MTSKKRECGQLSPRAEIERLSVSIELKKEGGSQSVVYTNIRERNSLLVNGISSMFEIGKFLKILGNG